MSRSTNNIGGDGGEKSSVKVSNAPGGKSSFSIGWGADEPTQQKSTIRKYNNQSSIFGGDAPVKTPLEEKKREEEPAFGKAGGGRTVGNIGGDSGEMSSVKIHHAPGGQSSFSFGNEPSQFDAPKRKENIKPQSMFDQSAPTQTTAKTSVKVHNPPGGKSSITFC